MILILVLTIAFSVSKDADGETETQNNAGPTPVENVPSAMISGTSAEVTKVDMSGVVDLGISTVWIPKMVSTEWLNTDGIPCIAVLVPLTGGAAMTPARASDVEVKLVDNNMTLIIAERCTWHYSNMKEYYSRHPRKTDDDDEDWIRRMCAMNDALEKMKRTSVAGLFSVFKMKLPWRAAEIEKHITGTTDGGRLVHIDIYSRKRVKQEQIFIADPAKSFFKETPSKSYSSID